MSTIQELKEKLNELSQERSLVESGINVAVARLDAAGVGMHSPLVDNEVLFFSETENLCISILFDLKMIPSRPITGLSTRKRRPPIHPI